MGLNQQITIDKPRIPLLTSYPISPSPGAQVVQATKDAFAEMGGTWPETLVALVGVLLGPYSRAGPPRTLQ